MFSSAIDRISDRDDERATLLASSPRDRGASVMNESTTQQKALLRSWTDRVVRFYASAALQIAGFSSASVALATTPEIVDEETATEARSRVNAALNALLSAREIPSTERALVATLAAREALALVEHRDPGPVHMKSVLEAMHSIA